MPQWLAVMEAPSLIVDLSGSKVPVRERSDSGRLSGSNLAVLFAEAAAAVLKSERQEKSVITGFRKGTSER